MPSPAESSSRLGWRDVPALAEAWWALVAAVIALRWTSLARLDRFLASWRDRQRPRTADVARLARIVQAAARRHVLRTACLEHTLTLQMLCARRGLACERVIGVRRDDSGLAAHAWVVHAGEPVGESRATVEPFAPLASATSGSARRRRR